jgi:hypothetical protein
LRFHRLDGSGRTPLTTVDERLLIPPGEAVELEGLTLPFVAQYALGEGMSARTPREQCQQEYDHDCRQQHPRIS